MLRIEFSYYNKKRGEYQYPVSSSNTDVCITQDKSGKITVHNETHDYVKIGGVRGYILESVKITKGVKKNA